MLFSYAIITLQKPQYLYDYEKEVHIVTILIVLIIIIGIIALWLMGTYNSLIKFRNFKDEAWSGIDIQLKRRFDLIPNLVETVKGYATHEQQTFENITKARAAVNQAGPDAEKRIAAENELAGTLRTLFAVAENYPELKATTNSLDLQQQLSKIEDELQLARRYYNGTARNMNNAVQRFPAVLVANLFGFRPVAYFETAEAEKAAPQVKF